MCLVYGRTLLKGGCSLSMWMNGSCLEHYMPDRGFVVGGITDERFVKSDNAAAFKHVFLAAYREAEEMVRDGKSVVLGTGWSIRKMVSASSSTCAACTTTWSRSKSSRNRST